MSIKSKDTHTYITAYVKRALTEHLLPEYFAGGCHDRYSLTSEVTDLALAALK